MVLDLLVDLEIAVDLGNLGVLWNQEVLPVINMKALGVLEGLGVQDQVKITIADDRSVWFVCQDH